MANHYKPLCFIVSYSILNSLHSNMNQELFEKHLCNQSNHYENYIYAKEAIMYYHQMDAFHRQ